MKYLIIILILITQAISCYTQSDSENHEKYWYYRARLKYFIYQGTNPGESIISTIRNRTYFAPGGLGYGQHMINFGKYIGILATEYKLLYDGEQYTSANDALDELEYALLAYQRLDECEGSYPWENYGPPEFDGYFIREDVPYDFLESHDMNFGLTAVNDIEYFKSINKKGHPAYVNEILSNDPNCPIFDLPGMSQRYRDNQISQDEAIGLLVGMALVVKCTPSGSWHSNKAKTITDKIVTYIRNAGSLNPFNRWRIRMPDGGFIYNTDGGLAHAYRWGFAKAASKITGNPASHYYSDIGANNPYDFGKITWMLGQTDVPADYFDGDWTTPHNHRHLSSRLAAIGDSWRAIWWDPFTLLPYVTPINTTKTGITWNCNQDNWETFYLQLWKFLHDKNADIGMQKVLDQLNNAPCEGPYAYLKEEPPGSGNFIINDASYGWASTGKFWHSQAEQNSGTVEDAGNYNGTDYMLLYNLYHLLENPVPYVDLRKRKVEDDFPILFTLDAYSTNPDWEMHYTSEIASTTYPLTIKAFGEIESTSLIDNVVHNVNYSAILLNGDFIFEQTLTSEGDSLNADVTFQAGEKIVLKPGFKVKAGAHFKAEIVDFGCSLNKSSNDGLYSDGPMLNALDSMYWIPYAPVYSTKNEEEDYYTDNLYMKTDTTINDNMIDSRVNIYPNPNKGEFKAVITGYDNENISVNITNILGKTIYSKTNINTTEIPLNISDQPTGMYYIQISVGNKVFKEKIVVQ